MIYRELLDQAASNVERLILEDSVNPVEIPTPDFGWKNKRYISDSFRVAHIERYSEKVIEVLHITCFPNITCGNPIFGFDIITTEKKPLAAFLDWSPVDNEVTLEKDETTYGDDYPLPEWAKSIFSKNALAIVPRGTIDVGLLLYKLSLSFREYIKLLENCPKTVDRINNIVDKQNFYCEQQQRNERTFNVLKAKLGEDRARIFMETILFPKIIK